MGWAGDLLKTTGKFIKDFPIIGDIAAGTIDFLGQNSANKQNIKMAREQMAFQERMSGTEMQRRTADLLAAGLNPMLAISQGGASSAQGARTEIESPTSRAVGTAMSLRMQRQQLEQMTAQTRLLSEQATGQGIQNSITAKTVPWSAANAQSQAGQLMGNVDKLGEEIRNIKVQRQVSEEDLRNRRLTNDQLEKLQPIILKIQEIERQAKELGLSQQKVDANFAEAFGDQNKWIQLLLQFIRGTR